MKGIIKFFKQEKGYGFVQDMAKNDFFFHISKSINKEEVYKIGDLVIFDGEISDGKHIAINVKKEKKSALIKQNIPITRFDKAKTDKNVERITIGEYERQNRYNTRINSNWSIYEKQEVINLIMMEMPLPRMIVLYSNLEYSLLFGQNIMASIEGFLFNEFPWQDMWYSKDGYPCIETWRRHIIDSTELQFDIARRESSNEEKRLFKQQYQQLMEV